MWEGIKGFFLQINLVSSIVGLVFLIGGLILKKKPPRKINYLYGYRTKRSMANQKAWDFAQRYSGVEMMRIGIIQLIFSMSGLLLEMSILVETIVGISLMTTLVILLIVRTETAIKRSID